MEFSNHMEAIQLSKIRAIGDKASELAAQGKEVTRLQVGEPDFGTPQHIVDAAIASLRAGDTHYAPNRGTLAFRQAISEKLWTDNKVKADPATDILVMNGCAEALFCSVTGLLDPGDEMIIIEPTFINYIQLARIANAVPVVLRAREEDNWLPDPEMLRKAITPKTRMILLNTPTNPTGAVYPRALLEEIAQIAQKNGIFVVSDEVYEKLIYGEAEHVSIASLPGMEDLAVTINGLSKAYAMTGWRLGYVAAQKQLIQAMLKVHQYTTTCLPVFVQAGGIEAIRNSTEDVERMRQEYESRRNLISGLLEAIPGVSLVRPQGTFYLYPNISASGLKSPEWINRLLEEEGVATVPGTAFDRSGEENIRISFASDEASLRRGAEKIARLMASLC